MQPGSAPIGFEGIFTEQKKSFIGFEQYEDEPTKTTTMPVYPSDDVMPSPNQTLRNNSIHSHSLSFIPKITSELNNHVSLSPRKSLSFQQLFAIYNEIMNEWCKEQWLTFVDDHTETYLTLDAKTNDTLTIQTAIDQYYLITGETLLRSLPECLLIRTESKTKSLYIPNSIISLDYLYDNNTNTLHRLLRYKLMAIICHSNKTNSKLMFYKNSQSNSWSIFYDQSILSPSHSNILTDDEQYQLESFIEQKHHINPSKFTFPLSALCNYPIIYVYMPEKK